MSRRPKTAPSSNGKAPRPPDVEGQIKALNEREMQNRLATRARAQIRLIVPVARKAAYLELAERFNEDLAVVLRACIDYGYAHFSKFASADGQSPFIAGSMDKSYDLGARPTHLIDPLGTAFPQPQIQAAFGRPMMPAGRPQVTFENVQEQVFGNEAWAKTNLSERTRGYFPSGATVPIEDSTPTVTPPSPPPVPDEEPRLTLGFVPEQVDETPAPAEKVEAPQEP